MGKLANEKIPVKVIRIICLCLIVVVISVVLGVYFLTKKSVDASYKKYKEIVAQDISTFGQKSLFNKDGTVNITYQASPELAQAIQSVESDAQKYKLLNTQYAQLVKFSNTYFTSFVKELAGKKKSLNRSEMNNLFEKVENLENSIKAFENGKQKLEEKTNTGHGYFDYNENNTVVLLKEHMAGYVSLIEEFLTLNRTFAGVHIELEGLTNTLNNENAKIVLNYAVMYGTTYFVINNFKTITDYNDLLTDYTTDALFVAISEVYAKSQTTVVASQDITTYNYLYNRTKNIYAELDNLNECAKEVKNGSSNPLYKDTLSLAEQDVLTFLKGVNQIVA